MARLVFLGRLEDTAGTPELDLALDGPASLAKVLGRLPTDLAAALQGPRVRLALNGALVPSAAGLVVADGDELAFLPPVSGG